MSRALVACRRSLNNAAYGMRMEALSPSLDYRCITTGKPGTIGSRATGASDVHAAREEVALGTRQDRQSLRLWRGESVATTQEHIVVVWTTRPLTDSDSRAGRIC
mmetsp:Transcript_19531/g.40394  ORF Transcript_19531/g.40394 Transcript_19531/m.40394 type:complete len:105 (+) Transcript_19531:29-343(+)